MQSTEELFGIDPKIFINVSYSDVLEFKIHRAKKLMKEELKKHYSKRDYHKITKLSKALKNLNNLFNELK